MAIINIKNSSLIAGKSIRAKITISYIIIILFAIIPITIAIVGTIYMSTKYNDVIVNAHYASELKLFIQEKMNNDIWDIVSGNSDYHDIMPEKYVIEIGEKINSLKKNTKNPKSESTVNALLRTLDTLSLYVYDLEEQINADSAVSERERTMEEIYHVSDLICELLEEYVISELSNAYIVNDQLQRIKIIVISTVIVTLFLTVVFTFSTLKALMRDIYQPLVELENFTSDISKGNFHARVNIPHINEFVSLGKSLNYMGGKLENLIESHVEDQKNLRKSEMRALQAQITPHFLYNTLDTIVWLAEEQKHKEVIAIVRAFSNFFRVSLSKGKDWILIEEELEHAKSYLRIQKIRYRDILQYEIIEDLELKGEKILKLLLQPIIENSLYHGLKQKRGKGTIKVLSQKEKSTMYFEISDNGVGMSEKKLKELLESLKKPFNENSVNGYGLYNVNRRLAMYYGEKYKLNIESKEGFGTKVYFRIPFKGR